MSDFKPFENESQVVNIGNLSLENRTDRVSIMGDVDITLDKVGLKHALALQAILDAIIHSLKATNDLPDEIPAYVPSTETRDPFA